MPSYIANTNEDERKIKDSDFIDRDGEIPFELMEKYAKKIKAMKRYNEMVEKNHPYIGFALKKDFRPLIIALLYIKYHYLNLNCLEKIESAYSYSVFEDDRQHYKQYELARYRLLQSHTRNENPNHEPANNVNSAKIADELLQQFEVDPNPVTADYTSSAKIADAFLRKLEGNTRPPPAVNTSHTKIEQALKKLLAEKKKITEDRQIKIDDHMIIAEQRQKIILEKQKIAQTRLALVNDYSTNAQTRRESLNEQETKANERLTVLNAHEKTIEASLTIIIQKEINVDQRITKLNEKLKIFEALLKRIKEKRKIANLSFNFSAKNIEKLLADNSSIFKTGHIAALHNIFTEKVKRAKLEMNALNLKQDKSRIMQQLENYSLPIFADYSDGLSVEPKGIIRHLELLAITIKNKLRSLSATPPNTPETSPNSSPEKKTTNRPAAHALRPLKLFLLNDDDTSDGQDLSSTMASTSDSDSDSTLTEKDKEPVLISSNDKKTPVKQDSSLPMAITSDAPTEYPLLLRGFRQVTSKDIADLIENDLIADDKAPPKKRVNTESISPKNPKDVFLDRANQKIEVLEKIIFKTESVVENLNKRAEDIPAFKNNPVYKNKAFYEEIKNAAAIDMNAIKALTRHCGMLRFSENRKSEALKQSCLAFAIQRSIGCTATPGATPQITPAPSRQSSPRSIECA